MQRTKAMCASPPLLVAPSGQAMPARMHALTDRNHSNAPSITRHHTLAEERAFIVTRRESVPVGKATIAIVPVAVYERESTVASSA